MSYLQSVVVLPSRRGNLGTLALAVTPCAMQRGKRSIGAKGLQLAGRTPVAVSLAREVRKKDHNRLRRNERGCGGRVLDSDSLVLHLSLLLSIEKPT